MIKSKYFRLFSLYREMKATDFQRFRSLIKAALKEDIWPGDFTSQYTIFNEQKGKAKIVAKSHGIICGLPIVQLVFQTLDKNIRSRLFKKDGDKIRPLETVAIVQGRLRPILAGERTALNFLQHLSGIATLTYSFVQVIKKYGTKLYDTRKTTPLLRELEKYAVRTGAGHNHRMGLYDMILIKDNHIQAVGDIETAINRAKRNNKRNFKIGVEVSNLKEFRNALKASVDLLMLDNMNLRQIRQALREATPHIEIEVSGRLTLWRARQLAQLGVKRISVGAITHSAPALDFSLVYVKS